jgi:beta-glucanase (GH16 family)
MAASSQGFDLKKLLLFGYVAIAALPCTAEGWRLIWRDEFSGRGGSAPDSGKWEHDLGGGGWGNRESQVYTASADNVFVDGKGHLVIRALRSPAGEYTSARLKTLGRFSTTYGKIEMRIKLPRAAPGVWAAGWMLGDSIATGTAWPRCSEIDLVENISREPATVHGTIHGPGYSGGKGIGAPYELANGQRFSDRFHIFSVVWREKSVEFFVDGNAYKRIEPKDIPAGSTWVFDQPAFILLNVAVGGNWPGDPNRGAGFPPQDMVVDYVRVYAER